MNNKRIPTVAAIALVFAMQPDPADAQLPIVSPTTPARAVQTFWTTRLTDHFEIY